MHDNIDDFIDSCNYLYIIEYLQVLQSCVSGDNDTS